MDKFFSEIQKPKKHSEDLSSDPSQHNEQEAQKKALPKGVVLGKDGKPCRSCTSFAAMKAMSKQRIASSASTTTATLSSSASSISTTASSPDDDSATLPAQCPPDVERLGNSTWTFLHTLSAAYPPTASSTQQSEMKQFLTLFGKLYPCWHCAEDFQQWMGKRENELDGRKLGGRAGLMRWMCEAHNEVNVKLGKPTFDCGAKALERRWGEGPGDGSCG